MNPASSQHKIPPHSSPYLKPEQNYIFLKANIIMRKTKRKRQLLQAAICTLHNSYWNCVEKGLFQFYSFMPEQYNKKLLRCQSSCYFHVLLPANLFLAAGTGHFICFLHILWCRKYWIYQEVQYIFTLFSLTVWQVVRLGLLLGEAKKYVDT